MTFRCTRPRGIMIYEMMLALTMLSTFAIAATYLLRSSLRLTSQANESVERASRFDNAVEQLRRDVWGAAKVDVSDPKTARIERAGEPAIMWSVGEAATLVRTSGSDPDRREWHGVAEGASFETKDSMLVLVEPAADRRLSFASQLAIAKGAK